MLISHLVVGPFAENSYVIGDEETRDGALVDPGGDVPELLALAKKQKLKIGKILITHAHWDHVAGVEEARRATGATTWCAAGDRKMLEALRGQSEMLGLPVPEQPKIDQWVKEGEEIAVGKLTLRTLLVPGHSPGHVAWVSGGELLSGDVLFAGSIGRTDIPGGDFDVLSESITGQLMRLPDATRVHPGHGPATTIGEERETNPFVMEMLAMRKR